MFIVSEHFGFFNQIHRFPINGEFIYSLIEEELFMDGTVIRFNYD